MNEMCLRNGDQTMVFILLCLNILVFFFFKLCISMVSLMSCFDQLLSFLWLSIYIILKNGT